MPDRLIHESANSKVFQSPTSQWGTPVVTKVLNQEYPSARSIRHFYNEYEILQHLEVGGVRLPLAMGKENNRHALVLAWVPGKTVRALARERPFDLSLFLRTASEAARILGDIHLRQVIHRDVSGVNLLLDPATEEVHLIDFGIASRIDLRQPHLGNPETLEGNLSYVSPEQTGRMNRIVDHRSDLYSLGVTFFEMLTGRLPFESTDALELVHAHIAQPAPTLVDVRPHIPEALSRIVDRLLAKNADDRYQSAYGLEHDLRTCEAAIREGRPEDLVGLKLGEKDYSGRLRQPQKLYGREAELGALVDAFARVADGGLETVLVGGYSGTGKSALVHEIHQPITERRGYFLEGKFDQYQRGLPYDALLQAFRDLVELILTEREERLNELRADIQKAVGSEGRVLVDVLPGLGHVIGPQPEVAEVGGQEGRNRFIYVFRKFVAAIASPEHPIVLFIDDLQWADSASLALLRALMTDPDSSHLLCVCAYRDNEVDSSHPFMVTVAQMEEAEVTVERITIRNLEHDDVLHLVSDALQQAPSEVLPLVELVHGKTRGNAFFVVQFLRSLYREQLLEFSFEALRWRWDLAKIRAMGITDNVVELMAGRVQQLPEATRHALRLAASFGNAFDLETLAVIHEASPEETRRDLGNALAEGLLIPLEEEFRFAHDRIQQAVYSLIPEEERGPLHLKIGRLMLSAARSSERREADATPAESNELGGRLFDVVNQLNAGADLIENEAERAMVAELDLQAGSKAKQAAAFEPAFDFFRAGIDLLGPEPWEKQYELTLQLHVEAAEVAYNRGQLEVMDAHLDPLFENARSLNDTVRSYAIRINAFKAKNRLQDAIDLGLEVLAKLGERFPRHPIAPLVVVDLLKTQAMLVGRKNEELVRLPEMTDPSALAALRILNDISSPVYWARPQILPFIIFRMVQLSLRHGVAPISAFSFATYGLLMCGVLGAMREGYRFGQLALALLDRFDAKEWLSQAYTPIYALINHWNEHVHLSLEPLISSYRVGLETGATEYACINANIYCIHAFLGGRPLARTEEEMAAYSRRMDDFRQETNFYYNEVYRQAALNLLGRSADPLVLDGEAYDRATRMAQSSERQDRTGTFQVHFLELILGYLFHDYSRAANHGEAARPLLDAVLAKFEVPNHAFYDGLAALAVLRQGVSSQSHRRDLQKRAAKSRRQLKKWAKTAPENYLHKLRLLEAEAHHWSGRESEARVAYDQAISAAATSSFLHEEALACERAAMHYRESGAEMLAEHYLKRAFQVYREWGAEAKLKDLSGRFPRLLVPGIRLPTEPGAATTQTITTTLSDSSILDLASVMKASTAISGEIVLADLLRTLMEIVIENAGAQRGVLVLEQGGRFWIQAEGSVDSQVVVLQEQEINQLAEEGDEPIPRAVVQYVARTQESLVLDDAAEQGRFRRDSYIRKHRPRSLLCVPLIDRGRLTGLLYLEHRQTGGAFDAERIELLRLLSGQIAISIDKALLLENLEETVRERTADAVAEKENVEKALLRLEAAQTQLVQAEKMASLGELTAGIAHEIKNPLNFVNNFAEISEELCQELREHLSSGDPAKVRQEIEEILDDLASNSGQIARHGHRANAIVRAMMQHATAGTGRLEPVALNDLLTEQLELAYSGLRSNQEKRVDIEVQRDFDAEVGEVPVAPPEMARVFVNLLDNAFDALREKARASSVHEEPFVPKIRVSTRRHGGVAEVRITDNGAGISPAVRDRIFEPFFTTKPTGQGNTGLGLSLSYDIVTRGHGGTLTVESPVAEGTGTSFVLSLPLEIGELQNVESSADDS